METPFFLDFLSWTERGLPPPPTSQVGDYKKISCTTVYLLPPPPHIFDSQTVFCVFGGRYITSEVSLKSYFYLTFVLTKTPVLLEVDKSTVLRRTTTHTGQTDTTTRRVVTVVGSRRGNGQ